MTDQEVAEIGSFSEVGVPETEGKREGQFSEKQTVDPAKSELQEVNAIGI